MDGESKIFTNVVKKWARTPLSRAKNSKKTSELNGSGGGRGKGIRGPRPFVPVGGTNRDKRPPFCPGWCLQPGQKAPVPPAGPASRWTRDKSHILSRAQKLPGQMTWNKDLFCSSVLYILNYRSSMLPYTNISIYKINTYLHIQLCIPRLLLI